jgi:hypothetical protein
MLSFAGLGRRIIMGNLVVWFGYVGLAALPFSGVLSDTTLIVILFCLACLVAMGHFSYLRAVCREARELQSQGNPEALGAKSEQEQDSF